MASKTRFQLWAWLSVTAFVIGLVVVQNAQWFRFAFAAAFSERRPALLADAGWDAPASARRFSNRFQGGVREKELLDWLEANAFSIDREAGVATRVLHGFPCTEAIQIRWSKTSADVLAGAEAEVSEAGCL